MQKRRLVRNGACALSLTAWGLGGVGSAWGQSGPPASEATAPPLPAVGTVLQLPKVPLLDGTVFAPDSVQGQVVVVYWWASTCPFCALQSPEMQKFWLQHHTKVKMLALSVDKKRDDAVAYWQKRGYSLPCGWVTPEVQAALPKPKGLPITLVIGRQGQVLQAEKGQMFPEDVADLGRWLS